MSQQNADYEPQYHRKSQQYKSAFFSDGARAEVLKQSRVEMVYHKPLKRWVVKSTANRLAQTAGILGLQVALWIYKPVLALAGFALFVRGLVWLFQQPETWTAIKLVSGTAFAVAILTELVRQVRDSRTRPDSGPGSGQDCGCAQTTINNHGTVNINHK